MRLRAGILYGALGIALIGGPDASSRSSSCISLTGKQLRAQAEVIFDADALRGPSYRGKLLSPARFRVLRYSKGRGPRLVRVRTAFQKLPHGVYAMTSEGIEPRAGERWRIYGRIGKNGVVSTGVCAGSGRLVR